jgi:hypothetical protein
MPEARGKSLRRSNESASGRDRILYVPDYEPTAQRLSVKAGPLGIRLNMSGLDTISEDGLDGRDRYLIQIWPGQELSGPLVLKSWAER